MSETTANPVSTSLTDAAPFIGVSQAAPVSPQSTDEQLMLALREGSEEAFSLLFARYKQLIFAFFSRRIVDPSRAEELAQETFIALFRAAKRYEPLASFRSYLYAVAFRILKSDRRKSQFRAVFFGPPASAETTAAKNPTEDSLWIRHALAKLDPHRP